MEEGQEGEGEITEGQKDFLKEGLDLIWKLGKLEVSGGKEGLKEKVKRRGGGLFVCFD